MKSKYFSLFWILQKKLLHISIILISAFTFSEFCIPTSKSSRDVCNDSLNNSNGDFLFSSYCFTAISMYCKKPYDLKNCPNEILIACASEFSERKKCNKKSDVHGTGNFYGN